MNSKTKLLLIAAFFVLAIPFLFTGNAGAVTAVSGTYNSDAAVQSATSGQYELPSNFFCVGPPSSWDGTSTPPPAAVHRDDITPAGTSPVNAACTVGDPAKTTVKNYYKLSGGGGYATQKAAADACAAAGYLWSGYSGSCGASGWTSADPDASPAAWYTDHKGCLRCHNSAYIDSGSHAGDDWAKKESYLGGGHKNMVRKVTPGKPWGLPGTDASGIYTSIGIDWSTGLYTSGGSTYDAYWIYGGNGLEGVAPSVISSKGGSYSCGRCHATGWSSDASINADKEPKISFPSINIGTGTGQVNLKGGVSGDSKIYSSWDRFGIQCSRCHVATSGDPSRGNAGPDSSGHPSFPSATSTGGDINALCMNCHRQEGSGVPYVVSGYKTIPAGAPASSLIIGQSHGAGPVVFTGHSHANQFLNSPHAKFTGAWGQIGCPPVSISPAGTAGCDSSMSAYNSDFKLYKATEAWYSVASGKTPTSREPEQGTLANGGACTVCHDVHKTVLENVDGQSDGGVTECTACHKNAADTATPQITTISHPSGVGTPFDYADPCAVCHMPGGQHIFRISTDANYTEFPDAALAINGGDMEAPTAADEDGNQVVWVDLDQACGQCHGGSAGATATTNNAPYISKTALAPYASIMHGGAAVGGPASPAPIQTPGPGCDSALAANGTMSASTGTTATLFTLTDTTAQAHTVFVYWGDGSGVGTSLTHTYSNIGTFQVTQTVKNPCGYTSRKVYVITITGGTSGKGTMTLSATPTTGSVAGSKVSYSVLNTSGVSITNGSLTVGGAAKVITLDPGAYGLKIGYQAATLSPLTYKSCDALANSTPVQSCTNPAYTTQAACIAAPGGQVWRTTGQTVANPPGVSVTGGTNTAVTLTCN